MKSDAQGNGDCNVAQDSSGDEGEDDMDDDMAHVGLGLPPPARPVPDPFQPHWTQR